jgi:hypothetical protein
MRSGSTSQHQRDITTSLLSFTSMEPLHAEVFKKYTINSYRAVLVVVLSYIVWLAEIIDDKTNMPILLMYLCQESECTSDIPPMLLTFTHTYISSPVVFVSYFGWQ